MTTTIPTRAETAALHAAVFAGSATLSSAELLDAMKAAVAASRARRAALQATPFTR